jgi:hypothetical protein
MVSAVAVASAAVVWNINRYRAPRIYNGSQKIIAGAYKWLLTTRL